VRIIGGYRVVDALVDWGTHNTRWRVGRDITDALRGVDFALTYYSELVGKILALEPFGCARVELAAESVFWTTRSAWPTRQECEADRLATSARLVAALSRRQEELEKAALLEGREPSPWLFPSEKGGYPLSPGVMSRLFREVRHAAALPHFILYDLRHTFATHLLMEGADPLYVSYQVGHSKPTTTLLYYAHFMPRGDKKHLDRMMAVRLTRHGGAFSPALAPRLATGVTTT
jgi:hypothetical protein